MTTGFNGPDISFGAQTFLERFNAILPKTRSRVGAQKEAIFVFGWRMAWVIE
jgi:hypothetical protein